MYEEGVGLEKDLEAAAQLYEKACEGKYVPSCLPLARMLDEGRGVPQDRERAMLLFKWLCDVGYKEACQRLEAAPPI
jgi:TPR repeat protein